jgi:hypothetical protein
MLIEGFIITNKVTAQNFFQNSFFICDKTYDYEAKVISVISHRLYL